MEEQRQVTSSCQNKPVNFPVENRIVVEWCREYSISQAISPQALIIRSVAPAMPSCAVGHY
jgi:hypothetical protein